MNTHELMEEVNRRATAFVVPAILSALEKHHANGVKVCSCSYCGLKAMATVQIAFAGRAHREQVKLTYRKLLRQERARL